MDVVVVSRTVGGLLASRASREAGDGRVTRILARVHEVFGPSALAAEALERARQDGTQDAVAAVLAWHARRDAEFAGELAGWAAQVRPRT